ncbi:hypothetical protein H5410_031999 [Solanum commersonii]|uniref:Uncharacterized protein n=1 Tax=Solanum commersonii TaxID=4109 RepID=A0A9J5YKV4_SOLCO|nr:hypothetical protein H5410_031999 [Solanum commersonii]
MSLKLHRSEALHYKLYTAGYRLLHYNLTRLGRLLHYKQYTVGYRLLHYNNPRWPKALHYKLYTPDLGLLHYNNPASLVLHYKLYDQACIDDIKEGIGNLFVAMAGEEKGINLNKLTIRNAEPGEILQNWTTNPSMFQPESW